MIVANHTGTVTSIETRRLFVLCFAALIATSFGFVLRAFVIDDWGREFALTETQKGEILGVGLWPFAISIALLSFVIDRLGFRIVLLFALACHVFATVLTLTATGYSSLYTATFILALGNGAVEAAVNPLVATLYRDAKTRWLNMLHAGWPGGLVLGGLLALALGPDIGWRYKIALVGVPVLAYAVLLIGRSFPASERVAAGVSFRDMLAEAGAVSALLASGFIVFALGGVFGWPLATQAVLVAAATLGYGLYCRALGRPLFILMLIVMIPLATTELGTDSWITSLMEPQMHALSLQPGWVLVYTSTLMLVLRLTAGPLVHRFKPLGLLALSAAVAALGLWSLSAAAGAMILVAATLYGLGKAFFWPTTLGFVAEQFPRGGAVTLNLVAAVGMLAVGTVGSVMLGNVQDRNSERALIAHDAAHGTGLTAAVLGQERSGIFGNYRGIDAGRLAALEPESQAAVYSLANQSKKQALRTVAVLPLVMLLTYLLLLGWFRLRGGYRAQTLPGPAP
jgi:MFS family permease